MGLLRYYAGRLARSTLPRPLQKRLDRARAKLRSRRQSAAKRKAVARFGRFDAARLYQELAGAGVRPGGVLMVHSAFGRFYNFEGTAEHVLCVLEELAGAEGTLVMPSHTDDRGKNGCLFDVRKSPVRTGIVCELFRRQAGVRRSLHPMYSVCAKGPLADALVADHHHDPFRPYGPRSPYARLAQQDAQIVGLGLPPGYTTFLHVVEDMKPERFAGIYSGKTTQFVVIDERERPFAFPVRRFHPRMLAKRDVMRVARHLSEKACRGFSIHGVPAFLAHAKPLLDEHLALTDRGITMYG